MATINIQELKEVFAFNTNRKMIPTTPFEAHGPNMTIREFTELLNQFQVDKEKRRKTEEKGWYKWKSGVDERTVRYYIDKICGDSKANLQKSSDKPDESPKQSTCCNSDEICGDSKADLGKNSDKPKKSPPDATRFVIGPHVQSLLMILCDSQYCGGMSYNNSLSGRAEFYSRLISNIDDYASKNTQLYLHDRVEYRNAVNFAKSFNECTKLYQEIQDLILKTDPLGEGHMAYVLENSLRQCLQYLQYVSKQTEPENVGLSRVIGADGTELISHDEISHWNLPELLKEMVAAAINNEPMQETGERYYLPYHLQDKQHEPVKFPYCITSCEDDEGESSSDTTDEDGAPVPEDIICDGEDAPSEV